MHRTDSFKDKLDDNDIKIRFVPTSCTRELRPLGVAGNDEYKKKIKSSFINWYSDELSKGMNLGKAASDVKIYMKLSTFKPILASWIVAALQQVTKETLIRGWEKHVSKNVLTIADCDYPNYLFHIYSMISRFEAHCNLNILFLLLTLSVPVIMAVFVVIL